MPTLTGQTKERFNQIKSSYSPKDSWLHFLRSIPTKEELEIRPPNPKITMEEVKKQLGIKIPEELATFWAECDGFVDPFYTVESTIMTTLWMRSHDMMHRMPFGLAVFFGGLGNGDQFFWGFGQDGTDLGIYYWNHQTDAREEVGGLADAIAMAIAIREM